MNKFKLLEENESSLILAQRFAEFGRLTALRLSKLCVGGVQRSSDVSVQIQQLSEDLFNAIKTQDTASIKRIAEEWESPDEKEGLVTYGDLFDSDSDALAAFNATLSGQTYAIAYASKTLDIETEVLSTYKYWLDHAGEAIVEIHANGYGDVLEKCLYKN